MTVDKHPKSIGRWAAGFVAVLVVGLLGSTAFGSLAHSSTDATSTDQNVPRGPEVGFCPTEEQLRIHSERYGFDYKPTVDCLGGLDFPDPPPGTESVEKPKKMYSFAEAQQAYDPNNRPGIVIFENEATGVFESAMIQASMRTIREIDAEQRALLAAETKEDDS